MPETACGSTEARLLFRKSVLSPRNKGISAGFYGVIYQRWKELPLFLRRRRYCHSAVSSSALSQWTGAQSTVNIHQPDQNKQTGDQL